jgi:hypothetical protein
MTGAAPGQASLIGRTERIAAEADVGCSESGWCGTVQNVRLTKNGSVVRRSSRACAAVS